MFYYNIYLFMNIRIMTTITEKKIKTGNNHDYCFIKLYFYISVCYVLRYPNILILKNVKYIITIILMNH
jgi:hypothetical protein